MKFLCDQCKAKYQIADEKVQGKTLRMKCRKCGHVIEIRASAEGTPASGETMQVGSLTEEAAAEAIAKAKRPSTQPAAPAPAAPRPAAGVTAPRPGAGAPPRPAAGPTPKPGVTAPRPGAAPRPGTSPAPGAAAPKPGPKDSGALANAFNKSMGTAPSAKKPEPAPASTHHDPPAEEWYVAIDEVPVGPIRLTELRAKYAQGAVTDDSLVWREGFEEWRPLRTLPDLHGLVREEVSGAFQPPRSSLLPPAATSQRTATRPNSPAAPRTSARPAGPAPTPAPPAARGGGGGQVIPFVQARGAVAARKLEEDDFDDEATQIAASPLLAPSPALGGAAKSGTGLAGASAKEEADPFAAPAPAALPAAPGFAPKSVPPAAVVASGMEAEPPSMLNRIGGRARGLSKGVVALIAAAALLIGVIIAVLSVKPKVVERVVEKRVEVPVSASAPTQVGEAPTVATSASAAPEPSVSQKIALKGGSSGGSTPPSTKPTGTGGLKGQSFDLGPEGPAIPGTGGGGGGGGAPLDGKAVESVVQSKRVGVRKQCYEPYSDKGNASATIQLKVNSSGGVDSATIVSQSGDSSIADCVVRQARNWRFPASEAGGTFKIPFIFST